MLRPRSLHLCIALAVTSALFLLYTFPSTTKDILHSTASALNGEGSKTLRLHLLIIASGSGLHLCRTLLSAAVNQHPTPVLIGWEGEGEFDVHNHLAKIPTPLRYLDALQPTNDDDIVLMIDGFDIFFQHTPEVLLKRYFETITSQNEALRTKYGEAHVREQGIYNSLLFGPDKDCWPHNFSRPACWAVPEPPGSRFAFGPETDQSIELSRPAWLNSGTLMGPVKDMRDYLRATKTKIERTYDPSYGHPGSDQLYFSDVWGDQEYNRLASIDGNAKDKDPRPGMDANMERLAPWGLEEGERTEFHLSLDYLSHLFQTQNFYYDYIKWISFNRSTMDSDHVSEEPWAFELQDDLLQSPNPFASLEDPKLQDLSWRDVPLGVNTAYRNTFGLLHFTGDKTYRDKWWPNMWFFPYLKQFLKVAAKNRETRISSEPINGINWERYDPFGGDKNAEDDAHGAWSDTGKRLSWDGLCKEHENVLFTGIIPEEKHD